MPKLARRPVASASLATTAISAIVGPAGGIVERFLQHHAELRQLEVRRVELEASAALAQRKLEIAGQAFLRDLEQRHQGVMLALEAERRELDELCADRAAKRDLQSRVYAAFLVEDCPDRREDLLTLARLIESDAENLRNRSDAVRKRMHDAHGTRPPSPLQWLAESPEER
ncbi:MAG: hypothetical protein U0230_20635 [Polyangiales bacterium]